MWQHKPPPHCDKVIYTPDVGFGRGEYESDKGDEREGERGGGEGEREIYENSVLP